MEHKYLAGFDKLDPKQIVKAWEVWGIITSEVAYDLLLIALDQHDHKDLCECAPYYLKLKEMKHAMQDEAVELEMAVMRGK